MKKLIISAFILLAIPSISFAIERSNNPDFWFLNDRIQVLEDKSMALEKLVSELQVKINQVEIDRIDLSTRFAQHASQATSTPITQIIQNPDQTNRINDLDRRVSLLERVVSSLQDKILTGINKVIGILEKLLK